MCAYGEAPRIMIHVLPLLFAFIAPSPNTLIIDGHKIAYWVYGDGPKTPILVLHGGPGIPHNYMLPLRTLAKERKVIFYDQLGCGKSDRPSDPSLWKISTFVHELAEVRKGLGLDKVILFGHSWGTILVNEYMATHPKGVEGIVFASPALDLGAWVMDARRLLKQMPVKQRSAIENGNRTGKINTAAYRAAVMAYYELYVCRLKPWPKYLTEALETMGQQVNMTMAGPNEFTVTGNLRGYNGIPRLKKLHLPVLFTCGQYDEAVPSTVRLFVDATPGAKFVMIPNASHLAFVERQAVYVSAVEEWLSAKRL